MSCHSSQGNRVVLLVAKHIADTANTDADRTAPGVIQHFFHTLLREGKALGIPAPTQGEVLDWIQDEEEEIFEHIPRADNQQETALKNLSSVKEEVLNGTLPSGATFHAWKYTAPLAHYRASQVDNPNAKVIAIDLDGCIYDFNSAIREWLVSKGWDRDRLSEPPVYSLHQAWGIDHNSLVTEMIEASKAGKLFNEGLYLPDGLAGARALGLAGHVLSVISARSLPGAEEIINRGTNQWLRENGLHVDKLLLVSPTIPEAKLGVHFDLLIDDHPGNVEIALKHGRKAILLDRLWNQESNLPRASYDYIVNNLEEFL